MNERISLKKRAILHFRQPSINGQELKNVAYLMGKLSISDLLRNQNLIGILMNFIEMGKYPKIFQYLLTFTTKSMKRNKFHFFCFPYSRFFFFVDSIDAVEAR